MRILGVSLPTRGDTSRLGGEETWNVTGKLSFRPFDGVELNVKGSYGESFDDHFASLRVEPEDLNCFRPGIDPEAGPDSGGWFCGEVKSKGRFTRINIPDFQDGVIRTIGGEDVVAPPVPFLGSDSEFYRFMAEAIIDLGVLSIANIDLTDWQFIARYTRNEDNNNFMRDLDRSEGRGLFERGNFHVFEDDRGSDYSWEGRLSSPQDKSFRGSIGVYQFVDAFKSRDRRFTDRSAERAEFGDLIVTVPETNKAIFGKSRVGYLVRFHPWFRRSICPRPHRIR